jgi:ribulose-5-phosphate 4-epimerase/fuculose-1-phosphate aldolase
MTFEPVVESAIRDLVLANRILSRENVIDDFGHVSVRHPTDPGRYFLSRSRSPEIVTRDDIMEFALDGEPIAQNGRSMYAERAIHGAIYLARSDVQAVAHHHTRSVLPFTVADIPLKPVFHMGAVIGPHVPVWDSQPEFGDTNMLIDALPKGHSLARVLGNGRVVLLRGHGSVCAARCLRSVCFVSIYLKENADLLLKTLPFGSPKYLTPGEIEKTADMLLSPMPLARAWDYWLARAGFSGL